MCATRQTGCSVTDWFSSTVLSLSFTAASALNNGNQDLTRHVLARRTGCKPGLAAWTAHDGSMDLATILTSKSCFQRSQEQSLVGCACALDTINC